MTENEFADLCLRVQRMWPKWILLGENGDENAVVMKRIFFNRPYIRTLEAFRDHYRDVQLGDHKGAKWSPQLGMVGKKLATRDVNTADHVTRRIEEMREFHQQWQRDGWEGEMPTDDEIREHVQGGEVLPLMKLMAKKMGDVGRAIAEKRLGPPTQRNANGKRLAATSTSDVRNEFLCDEQADPTPRSERPGGDFVLGASGVGAVGRED